MAVATPAVIKTLAFGGISGSYAALGTPITQNWRMFRIINATNGDLLISLNGTDDNFFVPATSFLLWDLSANAAPVSQSDNLVLAINTQFYAKQSTAPSSGAVWVEGMYAKGV